jgi:hypothetical protein
MLFYIKKLGLTVSQQHDFPTGGMYLKKSELILLTGSAGGRAKTEPPFRPPRQKAEAERTISSFSNPALRDCSALPRLAANCFNLEI